MHQEQCIKDNLYYVGAGDRRQRLFENAYPIPHGMSYNSYLILDEKTILFDSVDRSVEGLFFENLEATLGDRHLDYLVITHMEPDHAATLGDLLNMHPDMMIVGNAKIKAMIGQFFDFSLDHRFHEVKEGDTLSTGEHTFKFFFAPMVHWPEVMMVYDEKIKTLFSSDAFGSFGALSGNIFADELNYESEWLAESRRYYTNIVGKFGLQVMNIIKKLSGLDIELICALHGPIFRTKEDIEACIKKYQTWGSYTPEDDEVVIYSGSVYGHTEEFATLLATLLAQRGVRNTKVYDISSIDVSYLLSEAFRAKVLVFAASSYNGGIFTPMENFLMDLVAHNFQNRDVFVVENGSWAPNSGNLMKAELEEMKHMDILDDEVNITSSYRENNESDMDALVDALVASFNKK